MTESVRIRPLDYAIESEKRELAKAFECTADEREFRIQTSLCPVLICLDGLDACDQFKLERFHGCGHGTGGQSWMENGCQVVLSAERPVYVIALPGRYRLVRADGCAIDKDEIVIDVQDISFEWAQLWAASQAHHRGCNEQSCCC